MAETPTTGNGAADRALADERAALDGILGDFEIEQRRLLLMAVDKAIDKAIKKQSAMLDSVKARVATRQRQAVADLRDEFARQQPSMMDLVVAHTLDAAPTSGLLRWIHHPKKQHHARECVERLRGHLEARQGNLFRSDFEALLVVYMEYLNIPMASGSRLSNRIEDFKDALHRQASSTDELSSLSFRVNWACYGVRTIGNARSHDATPLSDAEILELCGCFSALGAAMPTLAEAFTPLKPEPVMSLSFLDDGDSAFYSNGGHNATASAAHYATDSSMDLSALNSQLRQLAGSTNGGASPAPNDFERLLQFLAAGLNNGGSTNGSGGFGAGSSNFPLGHAPPPLPPGYAPLPATNVSGPPGFVDSTPAHLSPLPHGTSSSPPPPMPQPIVPTQAALAAVPSFKFYHERPTELPKESDRTRMAMFARMINHMNRVPKARLCPFPSGHDSNCPQSHSYLEVMSYNPLFKRLVCRQPSHYWASQVAEFIDQVESLPSCFAPRSRQMHAQECTAATPCIPQIARDDHGEEKKAVGPSLQASTDGDHGDHPCDACYPWG